MKVTLLVLLSCVLVKTVILAQNQLQMKEVENNTHHNLSVCITDWLDAEYISADEVCLELLPCSTGSTNIYFDCFDELSEVIEDGEKMLKIRFTSELELSELLQARKIINYQEKKVSYVFCHKNLDMKDAESSIFVSEDDKIITNYMLNYIEGKSQHSTTINLHEIRLTERILDSIIISGVDSELDSTVCTVTNICSWVILILVLISIFNSFGEVEINSLFFYISFLQSNNLLAYINYPLPAQYICVFQSLSKFNFDTFLDIPDLLRSIFTSVALDAGSNTDPDAFAGYDMTSSWYDYGGKAFTALILLFLLWALALFFWKFNLGTDAFVLMLDQLSNKIAWNGFIRLMQVIFMPLLLSSFLQLHNASFTNGTETTGFIFAIITCILLAGFVALSVKLARDSKIREKEFRSKYGAIYNDYWLDKEVDCCTVNIEVLVLFKKFFQVLAVVFISSAPSIQAIIFLASESVILVLLLIKRRFKDKTVEIALNVMSVGNVINLVIICVVLLLRETLEQANILTWVIFGIASFLYLTGIGMIIAEQVIAISEIKEYYTNFFYGLWLGLSAIGSCLCCPCIAGNKMYWSRRAKAHEEREKTSQLALMK